MPSGGVGSASTKAANIKNYDKWGILMIHPTKLGGKTWFSSWDNGVSRTITSNGADPQDADFFRTGNWGNTAPHQLAIDGAGVCKWQITDDGQQPRMYHYDHTHQANNPTDGQRWGPGLEITIYGMRVTETSANSSAGLQLFWGNHQDQGNPSDCAVNSYYSRPLYGTGAGADVNMKKEIDHPSDAQFTNVSSKFWATGMPTLKWIGHKFIIQLVDGNQNVNLQTWIDNSQAVGASADAAIFNPSIQNWQKVVENKDTGLICPRDGVGCTDNLGGIFNYPQLTVAVRSTNVSEVRYRCWSIREIEDIT